MGKKISPAREAAFTALLSCEKRKAWSDQAIRSSIKKRELSQRDAALASAICYGVIQNRILLDFWINAVSSIPSERLDSDVRISLQIALYQICFLDRIPSSAAINESVELIRSYTHNKGSAGFTNAVLRSFQRLESRPEPRFGNREKDLSIQFSHPLPLVNLLSQELDGQIEPLLRINNMTADTVIQCNTLVCSGTVLVQELNKCGVMIEPHPWLSDCFLIRKSGDLEQLSAFQKGLFYVQDTASRLCVTAADPKPGDRILDACAAPGGKSFALAIATENKSEITARDLHSKKLNRIVAGAKRLGISCVHTAAADAREFQPELEMKYDLVLSDVPCSGLGIIRKKPDIRYKDLSEIENLPKIQQEILENLSKYVCPGGRLIYSTCTVLRRENHDIVSDFLKRHSDFSLEPFYLPDPIGQTDGEITLWPHIHGTDGFFIAKLRRSHG